VPRNVKVPLAGCVACVAALALLALCVFGADAVQRVDTAMLTRLVADPGSRAESLGSGLARLGDPPALLLMLALACGVALVRRRPGNAAAALLVVAGANLTTQMLKVLLGHPRVQLALGADQIAWSTFPSGHVTAAASIAIAFAFALPRSLLPAVAALGLCLVSAVSYAVLALAWHYPSDILGGILVASAWGFAVLAALRLAKAEIARPAPQLGRRAAISVK